MASSRLKLVVQIPCYREEETLGFVLRDLPREIPEVGRVEIVVIDDGSPDRTAEVARAHGADHVVRLPTHRGLARAFMAAIETSLGRGADIIVNTDGDNQYVAADIPRLIRPILEGSADIVVGTRPIGSMREFSPLKKALQRLGSWVVRKLSGTAVQDATSGFRAYSRPAAMRLAVYSDYTYTLETLIQAGALGLRLVSVPVGTNPPTRESRLMTGLGSYVLRSVLTLVWVFVLYRPLIFFGWLGAALLAGGALVVIRFLYFYVVGQGAGHVQSLVLGAALLIFGVQMGVAGLISHLIAINRRLGEDVRLYWRQQAPSGGGRDTGSERSGGDCHC